jgi:hypothetical protein
VRVEVVDVGQRHVRDGHVLERPALEGKEDDRDVAVMKLDPVGMLAFRRHSRPRSKPEHAREPPRGARRILVVERDAETSDLTRSCSGAVALVAPGNQPTKDVRPEEQGLLAAGHERLSHAHSCATLDRVEADIDLGVVHKAAIRELHTGLPDRDPPELERVPARVVVDLQHAAADARFDPHRNRPAGIEEVDRAADPPAVDLVGERGEGAQRLDGDRHGRRGGRLGHDRSFSST